MNFLETPRLLLCHLSPNDSAFILELLNEPSFIRFIGDRGVRTLEDARGYILNGPMDSYQRNGFGLYLIQLKEGNIPIGICGLVKRDGLEDADIGYAFLPQFWSQGYATEAASAVMDYRWKVFGLGRIVAITSPDNEGSIRVLEKLGLRFEKMVTLPAYGGESKLFVTDA